MNELDPIYINIPVPTKKEAIKLCGEILSQDLCGTAKIYDQVHLMWKETKVEGKDVCIMTLKTTREKLADIHEYILKNHSWGTPCIEVTPLLTDMC